MERPRAAAAGAYFRWATGGVGFALLALLLLFFPPDAFAFFSDDSARLFFLFVALLAISHIFFVVRIGRGAYFSISPVFLFVYFVLAGAIAAAVVDVAGRLIEWLVRILRRQAAPRALYLAFDIGQTIIASIAAGLVVQLTTAASVRDLYYGAPALRSGIVFSPIASLAIFAITYFVVSSFLASVAVWLEGGREEVFRRLLPTRTLWSAVSIVTAVPFAAVSVLLAPSINYTFSNLFTLLFLAGIAVILRLNVALREGNDDLRAINRIGQLISATLDIPEIFGIIARESRAVLRWDVFFIAILREEDEMTDIVFLNGKGEKVAERSIRKGKGVTGRAIDTRELVHVERRSDAEVDPEETRQGRLPRSILVAPMLFGERPIGAISVQSLQSEAYGPSQYRLLQTIAGQAAIAIRNAQLFLSEERAKAERDEFLSLVTHEIKSPLSSVKGYADLAALAIEDHDEAQAIDSLRVIGHEAGRILRLAEDLLDASKASAGKFSLTMEEVDLLQIATEVASRYRMVASRQIEVRAPEKFPKITGDSTRLGQVVENLVSNAVKYSNDGSPIELELDADRNVVRLSVRDRGVGIAPEKLPLIFERFYRVEEHGRVVKGTGLGLFITREIVRMHRGDIRVESIPGEGSTFTVEFPSRGEYADGVHEGAV